MAGLRRHRLFLLFAILLLVARAGMPLLAVAAAGERAVPVAEICTVYGIAKAAADAATPGDASSHGPRHEVAGSGHACPLGALATLAPSNSANGSLAEAVRAGTAPVSPTVQSNGLDAAAQWSARMHHPPPHALA